MSAGEYVMKETLPFRIIGKHPDQTDYRLCRRMLVGPWCNQPEQYEGYNGFVGWAGVTALKSGRWVVAFNSGYWHASYPWTEEIRKEVEGNETYNEMLQRWRKLGMPEIRAPRGGRCHLIHSDDNGLTWSSPRCLADTDMTDLHPTIVETNEDTLLCTFCSDRMPFEVVSYYMLSEDNGETWSNPAKPPGYQGGFGNGSTIKLRDGTILWAVEARVPDDKGCSIESIGITIYRSTDHGRTFDVASIARSDHPVYEPSIVELPDRRLALITRREGEIRFSDDGGESWSGAAHTGIEMFDPHLIMMPNGVLACFHGSYKPEPPGNLRVALSPDNGRTWHGPSDRCGYTIDPTVYGYSHPMVLEDGTVYLVYIHTGGHTSHDARTEAIWAIRVRINDTADGIGILPAPGAPAASTSVLSTLETARTAAGDPELGNLV